MKNKHLKKNFNKNIFNILKINKILNY